MEAHILEIVLSFCCSDILPAGSRPVSQHFTTSRSASFDISKPHLKLQDSASQSLSLT